MASDYTRRDFNTIKDDLLRRASTVLPEWTDRDPSDFGMLFVDLWAYMGDVLNYYIDRAAREAFLSTATQRDSVLAIANLMDYKPAGRSAAMSTVYISNTGTAASTIAFGTEFYISDSNISSTCYAATDTSIPNGATQPITVYEGKYYSFDSNESNLLGNSTGVASQTFTINRPNVVASSVRLFVKENGVDNTEYRYVSALADAAFGDRVFTTYTDATNITKVFLGNNINGFIPPVNSKIYVTFATSSGASGNYGSNTVTAFVKAVPSSLSIKSSSSFTGGVDEEGIESMRTAIPLTTRPQNRAVTLSDFIDLTLSIPGIYKASARYNASANAVTIYPVLAQSSYTTNTAASIPVYTETATTIVNSIQPKALLGVTVQVAPYVSLKPVNITANIRINDRYTTAWVQNDVDNALHNLLSFDNVYFSQRLSLSEIYHTVMSIEGVDYAQIDPDDGGVFSSTGTGVEQYVDSDDVTLLRAGTIILNPSGGIS